MAGDILEAVALQISHGDIIQLCKHPGISDMAAKNFVLTVTDGTFGDVHARCMTTQDAAIPSPIELKPVTSGAGLDIFEIEAEHIMPFDDVRVTAPNFHR